MMLAWPRALKLSVDHQGVVPVIALAEDGPPIRILGGTPQIHPSRFDSVVALGAEVDGPADTVCVEHEGSGIHVPVRPGG